MITRNRAQCALCEDIIESTYRWDFQQCSCGEIFVDGGLDYIRRGYRNVENLIDLSENDGREAEENGPP